MTHGRTAITSPLQLGNRHSQAKILGDVANYGCIHRGNSYTISAMVNATWCCFKEIHQKNG